MPLPRFADKVAALKPGEPLQLERGDLWAVAKAIGRDPSTVSRAVAQEVGRHVAADTRADIEAAVGVPLDRMRRPGAGFVRRRGDDASAA